MTNLEMTVVTSVMSAWEEPVIHRVNNHSRLRICVNGLALVSLKVVALHLTQ